MATSSNTDLSQTENFFWIFYCVSEIYVKFGAFRKKDQSHRLSIKRVSNCETGSYLNIRKAVLHATLRQTTC